MITDTPLEEGDLVGETVDSASLPNTNQPNETAKITNVKKHEALSSKRKVMTRKITPRSAHIQGTKSHLVQVKAGSTSRSQKSHKMKNGQKTKKAFFSASLWILFGAVFARSSLFYIFKDTIMDSYETISYLPWILQLIALTSLSATIYYGYTLIYPYVSFAYNCFLKPFLSSKHNSGVSSEEHQQRLENFYEGQADIYDLTRKRLLRGRDTLLQLCAAQLRQVYPIGHFNSRDFNVGDFQSSGEKDKSVTDPSSLPSPPLSPSFFEGVSKEYCWVDIGGGTGENVERMNEFFPIRNFERVYVVDITPSLCEIARNRFEKLGWKNVKVICADAESFIIPSEDDPNQQLQVALITLSYSLSMMESFYGLVDRLTSLLSPSGILGVVDFYVSPKRSQDPARQMSWLMRWFWSIWFDLDNIYLNPARREYLEYKFATVKQLNCRNMFIKPFVRIPYYVWIGARRDAEIPTLDLNDSVAQNECSTDDEQVYDSKISDELSANRSVTNHVTDEHIHGQGFKWRQAFDPSLLSRFKTYIYAFTWEDPRVDLEYLDLNRDDSMLVISSGGCNILEYIIAGAPKRIHCVDLNPCQNHLLELKLATISSLDYDSFWKLFGEGHLPEFSSIIDEKLSPYLSPYAYHFWRDHAHFKNFFKTGCSGLAVRVFQYVIKFKRIHNSVDRMCHADTLDEQIEIWNNEVRPHFLSSWLIRVLNNDRFLWGALGVPPAQAQMILEEGTLYDYVVNTFDPVIQSTLLKNDNYFYYQPLMLEYNFESCPTYLKRASFDVLKSEPERLDAIKIHTDTILNVLTQKVKDEELTKVIVMDHLDWFSEEDADAEIHALSCKVRRGGQGYVYYRSAGKYPWYNWIFEKHGFVVEPLQIREGETMFIDRVNMYASFWRAVRI